MKLKCPGCATVLNVPDSAAGKVVKCPCGKQLRAPGGAAAAPRPAAAAAGTPRPTPRPTPQRPAAKRPTPQRPAAGGGGYGGLDGDMFDELTDGDLKPVQAVARPGIPNRQAAPSGAGGKMLQQHASGDVRKSGAAQFRRGPLASIWVRWGAKVLDYIIMNLIGVPIAVVLMLFVPALIVVFGGGEAMRDPESMTQADKEALMAQLLIFNVIAAIVATGIPVMINAILIVKSGQTMGKKICKVRILDGATGELPGFVNGVLIRSWLTYVLSAIPFFALIDACMIFGDDRRCLHDKYSGTVVVEA